MNFSAKAGFIFPRQLGVSPIATCGVHQEVLIDRETDLRVLTDGGPRAVRREIFEFWPSDIQRLFAKAGLSRRQPPPFLPTQQSLTATGSILKISSPRPGATYTRSAVASGGGKVSLQTVFTPETTRLFWFDGDRLIGSCPPETTLRWRPTAGVHQVFVVDQDGRQDGSRIHVEVLGNAG